MCAHGPDRTFLNRPQHRRRFPLPLAGCAYGSCIDRRLSLPSPGACRWTCATGLLGRGEPATRRARSLEPGGSPLAAGHARARGPAARGGVWWWWCCCCCCGPRLLPRGAPHARGQRKESSRTRQSATTRLAIAHVASRIRAAHARRKDGRGRVGNGGRRCRLRFRSPPESIWRSSMPTCAER